MNVEQKIAMRRKAIQQAIKTRAKHQRQRERAAVWADTKVKARVSWNNTKDVILLLVLLNIFIGQMRNIDLAQLTEPRTIKITQEAQAKTTDAPKTQEAPKTPESADLTPNPAIQDIVAKVHRLESSGGKNDSCKNKGKVNGYGYGQNDATWYCYDSQEQVKAIVTDWFERNIPEYGVAGALCRYNTGTASEDCGYYQKYLAL